MQIGLPAADTGDTGVRRRGTHEGLSWSRRGVAWVGDRAGAAAGGAGGRMRIGPPRLVRWRNGAARAAVWARRLPRRRGKRRRPPPPVLAHPLHGETA